MHSYSQSKFKFHLQFLIFNNRLGKIIKCFFHSLMFKLKIINVFRRKYFYITQEIKSTIKMKIKINLEFHLTYFLE